MYHLDDPKDNDSNNDDWDYVDTGREVVKTGFPQEQ